MKILSLTALFLLTSYGNAQFGDVDPIQVYNADQKTYTFSLFGKSQGLKLDNIVYEDVPPCFEIHIVNNSGDTVINKYRERDSHIYWMRKYGSRYDTLMPGDTMIVTSKWPNGKPNGSIRSPVYLKYQIGGSIYSNEIKVWGLISQYKAPPIFKPKNPDITNNTRIDSLSISLYNLDSLKGQLYNNEVSVKFRSLNSSDSSFVLLDFEDEKTLFINRNSSGWVELQITERNGVSYMRTLYLPLYRNTENKPIFYIFKSDYVDYFQGTERPFEPDMDLVYIWSYKEKTRYDYKSKLDIIGINSISERFPAIHKYSQEISRSNQIEQLLKFDSIFITPVYSFEEDHCRYWSNQVEILTNPNMNVKELNELLNSIGIPNAFAINKYSRLKDYSNCSAFRIEFDTHDMLSYEFLTKLEILYNLKPIYKIFTHGIQGVYSDRYGIH